MLTVFIILVLISGTLVPLIKTYEEKNSKNHYVYNLDHKINYTWLENDDKYDAIVGISVDNHPICSGVLINKYSVITAANPIHQIANNYGQTDPKIYIHAIAGAYDKTNIYYVERHIYQSGRNYEFKPFGFDNRHSPIHDIVILELWQPMQTFTEVVYLPYKGYWGDTTTKKEVRFPPYQSRHYSMRPIIKVQTFKPDGLFSIAGHGFINRPHVKQNVDLEVVHYKVREVLQDCDEWIPRGWGRFICLLNIENFVGVTAGGALFYDRRFIGIGSFSVLKGNESILVFTDLRGYTGMKSYKGYVDLLPDNTSPKFDPDSFTPVANYWYLTELARAEGVKVPPEVPQTKKHRYNSFYS